MTSRLVLTCGEPAGIGPDVVLGAALCDWPAELLAVGSHTALLERSEALGLDIELIPFTSCHFIEIQIADPRLYFVSCQVH